MAQTEATNVEAAAVAEAPPAPVGDPGMIGLPSFIVGSICLGLTFLNYIPDLGSALAVIIGATVVGQIVAAVWAARLGQNAVAAVYGTFAGFWLSYALLVLQLNHNWFGVKTENTTHMVAMFAVAWLIMIVVLTLATLALPAAFTLLFVLVDLALALVWAADIQASTSLWKSAGWAVFAFAAVGAYLWFGSLLASTGKKGLPLGPAVLK